MNAKSMAPRLLERGDIEERACRIRLAIMDIMGVGTVGHLASASSIADIMAALYFGHMRLDPLDPSWEGRDRFILSKGHASYALYACLMELGSLSRAEIANKKTIGAKLQTHPDMRKVPGVEINTGSLGLGLSAGAGLAAGLRLKGGDQRVFVLVGDGELGEGPIWEAAMAASHYGLDRLRVIVDQNGQSATGFTKDRFFIHSVASKFEAFGWNTSEVDGHDIPRILDALRDADGVSGRPSAIIANTTKGKGFSFAENNPDFHHTSMTQAQFDQAGAALRERIQELGRRKEAGE